MSKKDKLGQSGMVSILVTMIMIIVITLIVLGFAQVARRNQREALDRQLASQAFYAAETGVNDVLGIYGTAHWTAPVNQNCSGAGSVLGNNHTLNPILNSASQVSYTCLIVSSILPDIVENNLTPSSSIAVPINFSSASDLKLEWASSNTASPNYTGCSTFTGAANNFVPNDAAGWQNSHCTYGVLRVDLFDADANGGSTSPSTMAGHTASIYLVPSASQAGSGPHFGGPSVISANCTGGTCVADLSKVSIGNHQHYDMRITMIYENAPTLTISSSIGASFSGAQLLVDSTGKAQDEIKRIQVRVPLFSGNGTIPGYALQSAGDICKRFLTLGQPTSTAGGQGDGLNIPAELCSSP